MDLPEDPVHLLEEHVGRLDLECFQDRFRHRDHHSGGDAVAQGIADGEVEGAVRPG